MRILCVDDDGLVLAVTSDLLRALGHEVIEANSGRDAAEAMRDPAAFDVLVTDIHMPGGPGGLELAEYARQVRPDLPIIYFSGLAHAVPLGIDGTVLRKPCNLGSLERALEGAH